MHNQRTIWQFLLVQQLIWDVRCIGSQLVMKNGDRKLPAYPILPYPSLVQRHCTQFCSVNLLNPIYSLSSSPQWFINTGFHLIMQPKKDDLALLQISHSWDSTSVPWNRVLTFVERKQRIIQTMWKWLFKWWTEATPDWLEVLPFNCALPTLIETQVIS